jgi:hypothetical protein
MRTKSKFFVNPDADRVGSASFGKFRRKFSEILTTVFIDSVVANSDKLIAAVEMQFKYI